jgi:hypothetical protein
MIFIGTILSLLVIAGLCLVGFLVDNIGLIISMAIIFVIYGIIIWRLK